MLAAEVERCLRHHPRIAECAVVALPDRRFGETVACAIVLADPQCGINQTSGHDNNDNNNNMEPTIRAWCEQQGLAGYKRPRLVFRVDELPRNSSGKVLKFKLVERFMARQRSRL